MFYDYSKLISYNALLNFVIGGRGVGKTFGAKKFVISDYLKNGNEFVYLRRYKAELEFSMDGFFTQLQNAGLFQDQVFKIKSSRTKVTKFLCNDEIMGYAIPLSTANILKSASYPKVKTIIFDEFLIDRGTYHYLPNEVTQFLDVVETIGRLRDIRVFILGNAISITNPYFNYFNLTLPYESEFKRFKDGLIVVNYIKNEDYRNFKKETRFGKLIDNTEFGEYLISNEWLRDSKSFISKRTPQTKPFATIRANGETYGIWRDYKQALIFISKDYEPSNPCQYAFNEYDHDENTILLQARNNTWFKAIIEAYRMSRLYFDNQKVKNDFMPILNKCLTY